MVSMDIILKAAEKTRRTSIPVEKATGEPLYITVGKRRYTREEMAEIFGRAWNSVLGNGKGKIATK